MRADCGDKEKLMSNNNIEYLLGIDGGGTKTEFLLTDINGNEITRLILDGSNPVNKGMENTCNILAEGISRVCKDIAKTSVFAGVAGAKSGENQMLINDFLARFGFALFDSGSDTDLALEIALKGENGTAVIMGTGIVAFARSDSQRSRVGGWGYMVDKGGSGFCFGSDALNAAFEFLDGRGGSDLILRLIEKKLGKSLENTISEIYAGGAACVASFAPVVFEAYKLGDSVALEIIERNAYEAAKIINSALKQSDDSGNRVVVCGGLCKQKEILSPLLRKYVEGKVSLSFLDESMVNGAIILAKRLCENA